MRAISGRHASRDLPPPRPPIRIAGLTLVHWTLLTLAGCGARALAQLLPFSATYDLSIALSLTGAPAATAIAAGTGEAHPFRYLRDVISWRRTAAVYGISSPSAELAGSSRRRFARRIGGPDRTARRASQR